MIKSVSPIKLKHNILYEPKPKYSYARDLINSSGIFTIEDSFRFEQIKQKAGTYSNDCIKEKLSKSFDNIIQFIQSNINDTKLISNLLIYNNLETLSSKFIKKLKSYRLFQNALLSIKNDKSERKLILYPSNVEYISSDNKKKNLPISTKDPLLVHPVELATNITGSQRTNEFRNSIKLHKNRSFTSLMNEQECILKNITNLIREKGLSDNFVYTNSDINFLNTLIKKYFTLNIILKKNDINVSNIEALLYHPLLFKDVKVGDRLPSSDIVIDKTKVYDLEEKKSVPAIMTFANTNSGFRLKMYRYDNDLFDNIEKIQKQYNWYKINGDYSKLNDLNNNCYKIINNSEIAEVFFQEKNAQEMKDILSENSLISEDTINQYIKQNKTYFFIRNLKNYNSNKYYNVSLPLIKNLKLIFNNNQLGDIFINALAYNNVKHSPAALYLRAGCEPISHTKEEIQNLLHQKDKAYDKPIFFMCHSTT